ncbi:uncharacterized protein PRCAT00003444001 [Priceomyces carsonii]|uniref:uncharacterized protein n=1 Tax=Priceomyces carsonii TaxID=28549 RepID=UPI002ED9F801|nr:unnamed protein product [Priceomyces carsonii]
MTSTMRQRNTGSQINTTVSNDANGTKKLYFYHEIDPWQQDNHFIRSGYVKETGSFKECFKSLFYLHNESVNIYTHLLPSSLILVYVLYYVNFKLTIYDNYLGIWEKLNFIQFGAAATFCMFMSSTFHCIKSHSPMVCKWGNQLDYFGIVILITCSLISIISFAFYDMPYWKDTFVLLFLGLGSIVTVLTLHPKFSSNVYRPLRSAMFIIFGLSGIFPIIVAVDLLGYENAVERSSAGFLALEGFLYILGAVLYAMRVPERFTHLETDETSLLNNSRSAKFDIFGHSHQIFHVMVVLAAYCHWVALINCYDYLHQKILPS